MQKWVLLRDVRGWKKTDERINPRGGLCWGRGENGRQRRSKQEEDEEALGLCRATFHSKRQRK